jgi:hypothetical protein
MKLIGLRKWLVLFVNNALDDEQAFEDLVRRLEESLSKKAWRR